MKKASNILLLVGGILQIVCAVSFLICGIVFIAFASPASADIIKEGLSNGTIHTDIEGSTEEIVKGIQIIFTALAVMFFIFTVFGVIGTIVTFSAKKKQTKGAFIAAIIFGFLSGTVIPSVGGIFGLIGSNQQAQPIE